MVRSGCCFRRGAGRIFYFRPGHETYPTYHEPAIRRVIANAVRWAAPTADAATPKDSSVIAGGRFTWVAGLFSAGGLRREPSGG